MTGREAVLKQLQQVDLTAGGGQGIEIQIMDMDIALAVRPRMLRLQDIHIIKLLCALRAEFEHRAHRAVAVDVGVLALDIGLGRRLKGDVLKHLHQPCVHLAHTAALGTIEDIGLGCAHKALLYQHLFDRVLHLFDGGRCADGLIVLDFVDDLRGNLFRRLLALGTAAGRKRLKNRVGNLLCIERYNTTVPLFNGLYHLLNPPAVSLVWLLTRLHYSGAHLPCQDQNTKY